jgi:hypothetical protein
MTNGTRDKKKWKRLEDQRGEGRVEGMFTMLLVVEEDKKEVVGTSLGFTSGPPFKLGLSGPRCRARGILMAQGRRGMRREEGAWKIDSPRFILPLSRYGTSRNLMSEKVIILVHFVLLMA